MNKRLLLISVALFAILGGWFVVSDHKFSPGLERRVSIGDSKSAVLVKLGKPAAVFSNGLDFLKYGGEVWAYGADIEPQKATRGEFPFKLRFFVPDTNDLLIVFDVSGSVSRVQLPGVQKP